MCCKDNKEQRIYLPVSLLITVNSKASLESSRRHKVAKILLVDSWTWVGNTMPRQAAITTLLVQPSNDRVWNYFY